MFDTVLFDLDGTLADTAPDLAAAANRIRTARGLEPLPESELRTYATRGASGLLGVTVGVPPEHPDFPALRLEFLANYEAHLADRSRPFPGIPELLDALAGAGIRMGVATNKQKAYARPILRALGLERHFLTVRSSDSEGCAMKPRPDTLLTALRDIGGSPERTLYVGDDPVDLAAARAAGFACALVTWGYASVDLKTLGADATVATPEALRAFLLES